MTLPTILRTLAGTSFGSPDAALLVMDALLILADDEGDIPTHRRRLLEVSLDLALWADAPPSLAGTLRGLARSLQA